MIEFNECYDKNKNCDDYADWYAWASDWENMPESFYWCYECCFNSTSNDSSYFTQIKNNVYTCGEVTGTDGLDKFCSQN